MEIRKNKLLSFLHFFIFGATIVGETVITSVIVSNFGSAILGKLYLINGILLLLMPILIFGKIDRINRGYFLLKLLKFTPIFLFTLFIVNKLFIDNGTAAYQVFIIVLYPISYLIKSVLFFTFWTIASDITDSSESKKVFPKISSAGFVGGFVGSALSWILLHYVNTSFIVLFWIILYIVAYFFMDNILKNYNDKLIPKESIPTKRSGSIKDVVDSYRTIFSNILVRYIAFLNFGIFVSIFLVDYSFWSSCGDNFKDSNSLSMFQYGFYVVHSIVTILFLNYVTPELIAWRGFTRIFSYLPFTLLVGSVSYISIIIIFGKNKYTFVALVIWQFFRYIAFENFFSPVYQMFFTAIHKENRGRAKTVIEGGIKPIAIIISSILITLFGSNEIVIQLIIIIFSLFMVVSSLKIKKAYLASLIYSNDGTNSSSEFALKIGTEKEKDVVEIINEFALFHSPDMKRLAIKLLVRMQRPIGVNAIETLLKNNIEDKDLYMEVARYAGEITLNPKIPEVLIKHKDSQIWHRTVMSMVLNETYLTEYKSYIYNYFFIGEGKADQIYAAIYLWQKGSKADRDWIRSLLSNLLHEQHSSYYKDVILAAILIDFEGIDRIAISNLSRLDNNIVKILIRSITKTGNRDNLVELITAIDTCEIESFKRVFVSEIRSNPENFMYAIDTYVGLNLSNLLHEQHSSYYKDVILAAILIDFEGIDRIAISNLSRLDNNIVKILIRSITKTGNRDNLVELITAIDTCEIESFKRVFVSEIRSNPENFMYAIDTYVGLNQEVKKTFTTEMIKALYYIRKNGSKKNYKVKNLEFVIEERLSRLYKVVAVYCSKIDTNVKSSSVELLNIAIHDELMTVADVAVDVLAILDKSGLIASAKSELSIFDENDSIAIIESLESLPDTKIKDLTIPILERQSLDVLNEVYKDNYYETVNLEEFFKFDSSLIKMATILYIYDAQLSCKKIKKLQSYLSELSDNGEELIRKYTQFIMDCKEIKSMSSSKDTFEVLDLVLFLKKNHLFKNVSASRLVRLADGAHKIEYKSGDVISKVGDRANHLYLLKEGVATIISDGIIVSELNKGDAYGEIGLFNQEIRKMSVIAKNKCTIYVFSRSYIRKMIAQMPELANNFLESFGNKLQDCHEQILERSL